MRITAVLVLIPAVAFCACGDRGATRLPTAPSTAAASSSPGAPPAVPPRFAAIRSVVSITAITPASGTAVSVRDCPPGPGGTQTILCTDQLRATFSVLNEGQERAGRLRLVFADGTRECAWAWLPPALLAAGTSMTFSASTVFLSSETNEGLGSPVSLLQPCQLPVTTTRIVIQMWEAGNPRSPVAVEAFDGSYTFVR